jgi:hypothetical protein
LRRRQYWHVACGNLMQFAAFATIQFLIVGSLQTCRLNAWISPLEAPGVGVRSPMPQVAGHSASKPLLQCDEIAVKQWLANSKCRGSGTFAAAAD